MSTQWEIVFHSSSLQDIKFVPGEGSKKRNFHISGGASVPEPPRENSRLYEILGRGFGIFVSFCKILG